MVFQKDLLWLRIIEPILYLKKQRTKENAEVKKYLSHLDLFKIWYTLNRYDSSFSSHLWVSQNIRKLHLGWSIQCYQRAPTTS